MLKIYDKHLYIASHAHVDLIPASSKYENTVFPESTSKVKGVFNKVWGNTAFREQILRGKEVARDTGYLERVTSDENMKKIANLPYTVLPVTIDLSTAIHSLIRDGQLMPFLLLIKQVATIKGEGDGIVSLENQGYREKIKYHVICKDSRKRRLKVSCGRGYRLKASHDLSASPRAMIKLGKYLLSKKNKDDKER